MSTTEQPTLTMLQPPTPQPWVLDTSSGTVYLLCRLSPGAVRTVASFGPLGDPENEANAWLVLAALERQS